MESKQKAMEFGIELINKLYGRGWKLKVWDNMGWHCSAENDNGFSVGLSGDDEYYAFLSVDIIGSDAGIWHSGCDTFKDPNRAVRAKLTEARLTVDRLNDIVTKAENDMRR